MEYKNYREESGLGGEIFQWLTKGKQQSVEGTNEALAGALEIAKQKEIAKIEAQKQKTAQLRLILIVGSIMVFIVFVLVAYKMYLNSKQNAG